MGRLERACLVMPFRNEARHLPEVLDSLDAQNIRAARVRYILVDSASEDDGPRVARDWLCSTGNEGELVRVERPGIAIALNAGIGKARPDEVVVRLDAHTVYAPDYVQTLLDALGALPADVWWVGGAQSEPVASSFGGRLVRALMTNPIGLGGSDMRRGATTPRRIDCNPYLGAFRPGVFQNVGGFDVRWMANEDAELAARVQAARGLIWFVPARCFYRISRSPQQTLAQWHRYGFWRSRTARRHPSTLRPRHFAPLIAAVAAVALALSPARIALAPLAAAFAALVVALREKREDPLVTVASLAFFPLVHLAFATGLLRGWLTAPMKADDVAFYPAELPQS